MLPQRKNALLSLTVFLLSILFMMYQSITAFGFEHSGTAWSIVDDFRVNDDTGSAAQLYPAIAVNGSCHFMITWTDYRNIDYNIYGQLYNTSSSPQSSNFKINDDGGIISAVAMAPTCGFVVAWLSLTWTSSGIYAQIYNSSGLPSGPKFKVNDSGATALGYPVIAMDPFGKFVITWAEIRDQSNYYDIYAQRYSSSGASLDTNFKVSDDTGHTWQMNPAIGMSGNGDFVIAWEDSRDGKPDIYAQRYDASGFAEGNNFKLNYDTVAAPYYPAIAMNGSGNFVIAWRDRRNTIAAIYAQRYNYREIPQGPNFKVNDDSRSAMDAPPSVAMDGSGRFIIAWQDYRHSSPDIYAQKYTSSGSPWGGNFLVPDLQYASSVQLFPKVAANSSKIFFTWGDNRRDQTGDIYAKIADWSWTDVKDEQIVGLPKSFELEQNYPNPFNPITTIPFQAGSPIHTTLKIYNILGQRVRTLVDEEKLPGNYEVIWDGKDDSGKEVASGIYFY